MVEDERIERSVVRLIALGEGERVAAAELDVRRRFPAVIEKEIDSDDPADYARVVGEHAAVANVEEFLDSDEFMFDRLADPSIRVEASDEVGVPSVVREEVGVLRVDLALRVGQRQTNSTDRR